MAVWIMSIGAEIRPPCAVSGLTPRLWAGSPKPGALPLSSLPPGGTFPHVLPGSGCLFFVSTCTQNTHGDPGAPVPAERPVESPWPAIVPSTSLLSKGFPRPRGGALLPPTWTNRGHLETATQAEISLLCTSYLSVSFSYRNPDSKLGLPMNGG